MIESVKEFREVELDIDTDANTSVTFFTEMPNSAMTAVASATVFAATTGRLGLNMRLPGSAKGKLCKLRITSTAAIRLFGARVLCRALGGNFQWQWVSVPVEPTAELFSMKALPIEPTGEVLSAMRLPIEQTPVNRIWVNVPVDSVA